MFNLKYRIITCDVDFTPYLKMHANATLEA